MTLSQIVLLIVAGVSIIFVSFFGIREMNDPASLYGDQQQVESDGKALAEVRDKMGGVIDSMMDVFASFQPKNFGDEAMKLDQNMRFQQVMGLVLKILGILVITVFIYILIETQKKF